MLTADDNELLCRVGPGTPMGELIRQYWIPRLPSSEFPEPDSPAKRMMLLGESFVMFRDSEGRMGAVETGSRSQLYETVTFTTRGADVPPGPDAVTVAVNEPAEV